MYWKRRQTRRNNSAAATWKLGLVFCAILLPVCTPAVIDKVRDLQDRFDKETHAGNKVKALQKLGDAQFEAAGKAGQAEDFITVGLTFEKYRDNVRSTLDLLKKQEPDADRHPGGYRQLELQARKGIREVEDALLTAPPEVRPPLEIVHKDMLDMDDELIRLLFPRRTPDPQKVPPAPEEKL